MANLSQKLTEAFELVIKKNYGSTIAPPAYTVPFGIRPLDVFLGGGLSSSLPVVFSSTPETGKSTIAFQFAGEFLRSNQNSVVVYVDVETACNNEASENNFIEDRISTMGIDLERFNYIPVIADIPTVFGMMRDFINVKKQFEEKVGEEMRLCIIWDSMAATPSSKDHIAEDPSEILGFKAREFSLHLSKIKPLLAINRVFLICIDQVRSNIKVDRYTRSERSVGEFGNYKAATSVTSLLHNVKQWLFFSRSESLTIDHPYRVDGWILNCYTEKNKIAPSNFWISLVFDKRYGIDKIMTEYHFIKELTPTERKYYKSKTPPFELPVKTKGSYKYIEVNYNGNILRSKNFHESDIKDLYNNDPEFMKLFDMAVDESIRLRIKQGYFKSMISSSIRREDDILDDTIDEGDEL